MMLRASATLRTSTVSAEEVSDQKVATVEEALRGRIPGVQIAASGQPGRAAQVVVRGQNGFGNPSPLYVVDGMYVGTQNPNLNPDDIDATNRAGELHLSHSIAIWEEV